MDEIAIGAIFVIDGALLLLYRFKPDVSYFECLYMEINALATPGTINFY